MSSHLSVRRFPLHIHITTLFVLLIISFGGLISWLQYRQSSELLFDASAKLFDQVVDETVLSFRASHQSVDTLVELLSLSPLVQAKTLAERQKSLPQLSLALSRNPQMATLQIGYQDGDYFIIRKLDSSADRLPFDAPDTARFVMDNIERGPTQAMQQRLFFDAQLNLLKSVNLGQSHYDPRERPWFQLALTNQGNETTEPYHFYFMRQLGVTVVRNAGAAVVSADITLNQLSSALAGVELGASAQLLLLSPKGDVLAYPASTQALHRGGRATQVEDLVNPVVESLGREILQTGMVRRKVDGQLWVGQVKSLQLNSKLGARLVLLVPEKELLAGAYAQQRQNLLLTLLLMGVMLPLTWYLANRVARPLRQLALEAAYIQRFDFSARTLPNSQVVEISQLKDAILQMKETISRFLKLTHALADEPDLKKLQHKIVAQTRKVSHADGAILWLLDEEAQQLVPASVNLGGIPFSVDQLPARVLSERTQFLLEEEEELLFHRLEGGAEFKALFDVFETDTLNVLRLPLVSRSGDKLGVLSLFSLQERQVSLKGGDAERELQRSFIRELSGFAAVTIESGQLLEAQKTLLQAFIQLLAGAIDAKSPYTGGHCQRVPELSKMLAQAACDSDEPLYADYKLDDQGWEALHIGSWLHDCGKVTTPEYVVDKATKLETLYDRIHEVRMRFEVLKRDAELEYWQALSEQPEKAQQTALKQQLDQSLATLDEEFAFIAECNLGGEFMAPEKMERLAQIAERTWQRTLDDRAGVSHEELARHEKSEPQPLPVTEQLLADKPWHRIPHDDRSRIDTDNRWGFKLDVPEQKYDRGELHNLGVERGTLTAEERYRINDHIVQTIIMLEQLPLPKHLRQVPEIAGGHHEQINGTGYPRRLSGDQMSLTARMIAIADVFEALTASDRPYKPAKKLSQALKIMQFMCRDGHLDIELFNLFLERGIPEQYAEAYLKPEQIDPIDPEAFKVSV